VAPDKKKERQIKVSGAWKQFGVLRPLHIIHQWIGGGSDKQNK
jgi:hypothetical protein